MSPPRKITTKSLAQPFEACLVRGESFLRASFLRIKRLLQAVFYLALTQAQLFSCEARPSQQKKFPTYPFCCLLSPWFSLNPRRGPSATSWAPSPAEALGAALCVAAGCRGTLTAGLAALGAGGRCSALGLALTCSPGTAKGAGAAAVGDGAATWAGAKAEDGDGMEVTLEEVTAPNGLGVLL